MKIKQYVMAYRADENEIKRLLPPGFESLRPVLRINVECFDGDDDWGYVEFNTPVAAEGKPGGDPGKDRGSERETPGKAAVGMAQRGQHL